MLVQCIKIKKLSQTKRRLEKKTIKYTNKTGTSTNRND